MSFGTKQYQHRFYTAPKMRDRHITDFISPQQSINPHYPSVSSFAPYPRSPYPLSPVPQHSMKQSYIRLVNNGMNSRLYTKDQLGYEGVKFQKDVISRYCGDDYKRNSEILQKFKREAEECKRMQKHRHLRESSAGRELGGYDSVNHHMRQGVTNKHIDKNNISLLPITNSGVYHHRSISSPDKLFSIKNTKNLIQETDHNMNMSQLPYYSVKNTQLLPSIRLQNHSSFNSHNHHQSFRAINEEQSHHQNQDNLQGQDRTNLKHSIVRDVGINAHLSTQQAIQPYKKRKSQQLLKDKNSYDKKKSQSLRIQTMKLKNKSMKKRYQKLKQQLMEKSVMLSKNQQLELERVEMEEKKQQQQNFKNLQVMIHDLCNKLRENNSKIQMSKRDRVEEEKEKISGRSGSRVMNRTGQQTKRSSSKRPDDKIINNREDLYNQTEINTLKSTRINQSSRIQQLLKQQQMRQNLQRYQRQLQKIESYRLEKPKIIYSISNKQKIIKNDGLRLLKNRIQEKHYHLNIFGNFYPQKQRSKTQGNLD